MNVAVGLERRACRGDDRYNLATVALEANSVAPPDGTHRQAVAGELFDGYAQQPVRAQLGDRAVHNAVVVSCAMVLAREHVAASADRDATSDDLAVDARAVKQRADGCAHVALAATDVRITPCGESHRLGAALLLLLLGGHQPVMSSTLCECVSSRCAKRCRRPPRWRSRGPRRHGLGLATNPGNADALLTRVADASAGRLSCGARTS
jgi:hypothetical protein